MKRTPTGSARVLSIPRMGGWGSVAVTWLILLAFCVTGTAQPLDFDAVPDVIANDSSAGVFATGEVDGEIDRQVEPAQAPDQSSLADLIAQSQSPEKFNGYAQAILTLGVLSLAPAILLMGTCYIRVVVVLSLLRQALGGQNLPPQQVITALSLFVTMLVMMPVWKDVQQNAIEPYGNHEITWAQAWETGSTPVKRFMSRQIEMAGNSDDIWLFFKYLPPEQQSPAPETYQDVPIQVLLPAFVVSELKIAFLIGFQIFVPFVVVDLVVSSVTTSMGMFMLPPAMISVPLKIILFVIVDGWNLIVGMLLQSFV